MKISNTHDQTALYDIAGKIADLYRNTLEEVGAVNEGTLKNFDWDIDWDGNTFNLSFDLEDYWKWVEEGRPPTRGDGWDTPIEDLKRWIQVKQIVPRPTSSGKIPKIESIAYAIYMKITKEGYEGRRPLEKAMDKADSSGLVDTLTDELGKLLDASVDEDIERFYK